MASFVSVQVENAVAVENYLKKIETRVARKIVRVAVRNAQKPTLTAARALAKSMVGGEMGSLISKNIKIVTPKQKKGAYRLQVGISSKANELFQDVSKTGTQNYIPAAIEYGHGSNKDQAAIPYLRTANLRTEKGKVPLFNKTLKRGIADIRFK